ncbi:GNAT family N-acetyltransferase [Cupriavidus basilensis]|uniref:GNAT family N-acetyltransferase n=1 Tax=Cupriavidus basilensis TaxID=68895 RepID=A0ABT6AFP5_9BURK|nr:GNAT family N-acetyltransferase [Cupriavidus basilensis]MDF3831415.1 GNAT family N-acetyltransferase [Cupriavidus basilensis]
MMHIHEIETDRLRLRQWQDSDYPIFARMNADAETMRFFPTTLTVEQSNAMAQYCRDLIEQQGWGVWAVEEKATAAFIGFIGLHIPTDELPFSPCVEIAWRLAITAWGKGFATEGASATLSFAFGQLAMPEIVSFTALNNTPSVRVMQRLGMRRDAQTFEHPSLPSGHTLREHVLYRAFPGERAIAFM